jgi:hypothetical protein
MAKDENALARNAPPTFDYGVEKLCHGGQRDGVSGAAYGAPCGSGSGDMEHSCVHLECERAGQNPTTTAWLRLGLAFTTCHDGQSRVHLDSVSLMRLC